MPPQLLYESPTGSVTLYVETDEERSERLAEELARLELHITPGQAAAIREAAGSPAHR